MFWNGIILGLICIHTLPNMKLYLATILTTISLLATCHQGKAAFSISELKDSVAHSSDPMRKAGFLYLMGTQYRDSQPLEAEASTNEAIQLIKDINQYNLEEFKLKTSLYLLSGKIQLRLGNINNAEKKGIEALHYAGMASALNPYLETQEARALNLLGQIYLIEGNYRKAFSQYNQALGLVRKSIEKYGEEHSALLIETHAYLGELAYLLDDRAEAEKNFEKARDIESTLEKPFQPATAILYDRITRYGMKFKDVVYIFDHLSRQGMIVEQLDIPYITLKYKLNEARFQKIKKHNEKALLILGALKNTLEQSNYQYLEVEARYLEANIHMERRQFRKAIPAFKEGLEKAEALGANVLLLEGNKELSAIYEERGDWRSSLTYYHDYLGTQNEMFIEMARMEPTLNASQWLREQNHRTQHRIADLEIKLRDQHQRVRNRYYVSLLGISLLGIVGAIIFHLYRLKQKNNSLLARQKETIEATMNELTRTVAELEDSREKLERANRVQNKIMTIISHDLRGQFGGMEQFAWMMKNDVHSFSKDKLESFAGHFHSSAKKVNSLFENLIQWARSQMGEVVFQPEVHDLEEVIRQNMQLQEEHARKKGIEIHSRVSGPTKVFTDVNMLNFILRNLISNGLKFTSSEGWVIVDAVSKGNRVKISVMDNGIGMPQRVQERLFDLSKSSSREGTSKEKGTGIGLVMCAEFAQMMGTQMNVSSLEGEGSTISFTIPLHVEVKAEKEKLLTLNSGS